MMEKTAKRTKDFVARACITLLMGGFFHCVHGSDRPPLIDWRDLEQGAFIGEGSFGTVYLGRWLAHEDVALKILNVRHLNAHIQREFDREAQVMWRSQFPRVIRLYGICIEPGRNAMVLERMQTSLYDYLHSDEPLTENQRWQWAIDIAHGLTDLHGAHILHRDLKSHNVLLDARGRAKLADFGLAKFRLASSTATQHRSHGTLRWRAPELLQAIPPQPSPSMDMYSYGVVLWEMLTRQIPFETQPDDSIIMTAIREGAREQIPEACPESWRDIIQTCWHQNGATRPSSATVLERLTTIQPEKPKPPLWFFADPSKAVPGRGFITQPADRHHWSTVLQHYAHHPVSGYDVGNVEVIYHPGMNNTFAEAIKMLQQRKGNPRYIPDWSRQGDVSHRQTLHETQQRIAEAYGDDNYPDVTFMPLWHGTQRDKINSILSAGYTPFGETDDGYFGKGIYMTDAACYAQLYANRCVLEHNPDGVLILNWVASYSSYPIIRDDFDTAEKRLVSRITPGKYDAHFVPVVRNDPMNPVDYRPIESGEVPQYSEMVILEKQHVLPRYLVTLQPTMSDLAPDSSQRHVMDHVLEQHDQAARLQEQRLRALEQAALAERQAREEAETMDFLARERFEAERKARDDDARRLRALEQAALAERQAREEVLARERLEAERKARDDDARRARGAGGGSSGVVERPIPPIARGHEEVYRRFINGRLVYKGPAGERSFSISDSVNSSFEGEFNLSGLTYKNYQDKIVPVANDLRIKLGYRKEKESESKVTVWLSPKFLIDQSTSAFKNVSWTSDMGIFWTWGNYDVSDFDYLTTMQFDEISTKNLYVGCARWRCPVDSWKLRTGWPLRRVPSCPFFLYF